MNFSSQQIEAITQRVLRELNSRGIAVASAHSVNGTSQSAPKSDARGLPLNDKVITEKSLAAAAAAGRTISVATGAIITPSGHDYIRRHGITITSTVARNTVSTTGTMITVGDCSAATSAASTAGWTALTAGCERDAASKARELIGSPVVCCGGIASITACLLNRSEKVRAAVVTLQTDVTAMTAAMQPNVLCLESAWAFSQLLKLLRGHSAGKGTPADWKELSR